ncbi:MAG: lysine--tRNA ligase [Phycisphaerales bacterium]
MSDEQPPELTSVSDQEHDRRAKLTRIRAELADDGYGRRTAGLITLADAKSKYNPDADAAHKADANVDDRPRVRVAGRVMLHRDIGKLIFMTLRDATGDLQIAVSKKSVDDASFQHAKLIDLGDIVTAAGPLGSTKTGEITIWVGGDNAFTLACKSLAPAPGKWAGLQDAELRYRKRYVDLYANPDVMRMMQLRIRIIDEIRQYFRGRGFVEVETPMLQPIHGGAAARPFVTHHNALDMRLFLRIAPELYLKRLLVGGFSKVFEINRNFRNEGISPRHNPEFTMLEAYEAFGSWETMADLVEDMTCTIAQKVFGTLKISHEGAKDTKKTINLERPWRRVSMVDLVEERTDWKFDKQPLSSQQIDDLRASNHGKDLKLDGSPAEQLVEVYEKLIEHTLIDPTFVTHVPSVVIPLARENRDDPFFADVYELAINGQEISPGYSELNDPDIQERHFRHQVGEREEQQQVDEDFLNALKVGMPPAGGMGLGIDRLVMMLTGAESIRDVILFPLMRPQA